MTANTRLREFLITMTRKLLALAAAGIVLAGCSDSTETGEEPTEQATQPTESTTPTTEPAPETPSDDTTEVADEPTDAETSEPPTTTPPAESTPSPDDLTSAPNQCQESVLEAVVNPDQVQFTGDDEYEPLEEAADSMGSGYVMSGSAVGADKIDQRVTIHWNCEMNWSGENWSITQTTIEEPPSAIIHDPARPETGQDMCELAVELEMTDPVDTKFDYETIDGTHLSGKVFSFNPADEWNSTGNAI